MNKFCINSLFIVLLGLTFVLAQNNADLKSTIIEVVTAFKNKDDLTLNKLISKEIGLITLYRRGVFDQYNVSSNIDFKKPIPEYLPYFDFITDYKLSKETLPEYDCDKMKWNKIGIFYDISSTNRLLFQTTRNLKEIRRDDISLKEIESFKLLEAKSRRVILTDKNGSDLIFYLSKINNKWLLTIIDRVTSDCSA